MKKEQEIEENREQKIQTGTAEEKTDNESERETEGECKDKEEGTEESKNCEQCLSFVFVFPIFLYLKLCILKESVPYFHFPPHIVRT